MINLIKNEHIKLISKRTTKAAFISIIILNILISLVIKILLGRDIGNFMEGMADSSGFLIILSFVMAGFAGGMMSSEYELGTIKFLLIRPISRVELILAKFIGSQLLSLYFIILFLLSSLFINALIFGYSYIDSSSHYLIIQTMMKYLNELIECFMVSSLALTFSTIFKNSAISVGAVIALTVIGASLNELLSEMHVNWGKYLLFSNTNFLQYLTGEQPLFHGMTPLFSLSILAGYFILFMFISILVFAKSDVTI